MKISPWLRTPLLCVAGVGFAVAALSGTPQDKDDTEKKDDRRPSLNLKASPMLAFSPARITFTAELRGGASDYEDYYCPTVEWDWGDGTKSESTLDCAPYEAGKSEIRRRFTIIHYFRTGGAYRIQVRLKRKERVMTSGTINVEVRPGLRDGLY